MSGAKKASAVSACASRRASRATKRSVPSRLGQPRQDAALQPVRHAAERDRRCGRGRGRRAGRRRRSVQSCSWRVGRGRRRWRRRAALRRWRRPAAAGDPVEEVGVGHLHQRLEIGEIAVAEARLYRHRRSGREGGPSRACRDARRGTVRAGGGRRGVCRRGVRLSWRCARRGAERADRSRRGGWTLSPS